MAQAMHHTPGFRPGIGKKQLEQTRRGRALDGFLNAMPNRLVEFGRNAFDAQAALSLAMGFTNPLTRTEARETFESGQVTESFGVLIQGAVFLAVGIFVVIAIFDAIPTPEDAGPLADSQVRLEELTGQAFEIAPIVLIVIVAFVIMQYVRGM